MLKDLFIISSQLLQTNGGEQYFPSFQYLVQTLFVIVSYIFHKFLFFFIIASYEHC